MDRRIVKVCGITCEEDLLRSVEWGANALGFNFYPKSPRCLRYDEAEGLLVLVPEGVLKVAVVVAGKRVEDRRSKIEGAHQASVSLPQGIDWVQIHGVDSEAEIPQHHLPLLVATSPQTAVKFPNYEIIIDTSWGKGELADWNKLKSLKRQYILSGGLNPDNVGQAIDLLDPSGVDVCSGVEMAPGKKDPNKLRKFLDEVGRRWRASSD